MAPGFIQICVGCIVIANQASLFLSFDAYKSPTKRQPYIGKVHRQDTDQRYINSDTSTAIQISDTDQRYRSAIQISDTSTATTFFLLVCSALIKT